MTDPGAELALRATPVLPMSPDQAKAVMVAYEEMCRAVIGPEDRQRVDDKEFVKRSGFQKLAAAYGVSVEILHTTVETVTRDDEQVLVARVVARAIHPSGRHSDGDGVCASNERRFRRGDQRMEHNLQATATTRAVNRAISNLIAFGSVSAEEAQEGEHGPSGPLQVPDWALPVRDTGMAAQNLTRILKAAGIEETHPKVTEIGNTIMKLCGGEFPFVAARLAGLLADAVEQEDETQYGTVETDATETTNDNEETQ